jgi:radical SAM/Cys-rich protein
VQALPRRCAPQRALKSPLRRLNSVGYGREASGLVLNLVYNPVGAFLPPEQSSIERDFKCELWTRYAVSFNCLYTITNMPIKRFLDFLRRSGNEERCRRKLVEAFNPATIEGLMCRTLVSVNWTGRLYDCDFNQMLELGVQPELPQTIVDFDNLSARNLARPTPIIPTQNCI